MSIRPAQVFISYQRADEAFARQVREHLAAHGVRTWMDQYDIPVGAYWPDEIDTGLAGSAIVVGILSPDAAASRNVKNEWDWAIAHDRRLLLLMVRPTDIPHRYISINFIDAAASDQSSAFAALLQSLGVAPAAPDAVATASGDGEQPIPTRHGHGRSTRRRRQPPLTVGREREQALLNQQLDKLLAGNGSIVLVGGEAGIGKTTLTSWLAWAAEQRDAVVCVGGCYDLTTTPPYGPWIEIVRTWPVDEPGFSDVPPALRGGDALAHVHSQAALFEIASEFFAAACVVKPLVLLLEDMHWTDQASLELLRYLGRTITQLPLMVVVTYRDDEVTRRHPLAQVLPALIREAGAVRVALMRLDRDEINALIARRYPLADADRERLTDYVERVTEGNPFFAGEVLRALEEAGVLAQAGDAWQVSGLDRVHVPELVRQVIEGRLERLSDDVRRLLGVAAVIGHEVDLDVWVEVSGADEEFLVEILEQAIEAHLVEELPGQTRLRFTHALVRETLYADLVSLRRRSWHRRCGDILSRRPRPDPDAVARHYRLADDSRATEWLIQAGERAQLAYAWSTAVERYEAALSLLTAADADARERGWLQYRIARLQRFRNPQEAIDYLDEALRIAFETGDEALAAAARYSRGLCWFFVEDNATAIEDMSAGADMLEALPAEEQARLDLGPDEFGTPTITTPRGFLVVVLAVVGRLDEALRMGEATRERLPRLSPLGELGWSHYGDCYGGLALTYAQLGRVDEAEVAYERARTIHRTNGNYLTQAGVGFGQLMTFSLPYRTEQHAEHELLVAEIATANTRSAAVVGTTTEVTQVPILALAGRWDEARAIAHQVLDMAVRVAMGRGNEICHNVLGQIARNSGALEEGWQHVDEMLPLGCVTEPGVHRLARVLATQRLAIDLALDGEDVSLASNWLAAHERWLTWSGTVLGRSEHHALLARFYRQSGDSVAAREAARAALQHASTPRQPLALIAAQRMLGELLTASSEYDDAAHHLRESLALADACAAPFERALTLVALAERSIVKGEHDAAHKMLAEARTICEGLGALPALERIAVLERRVVGDGV